MTLSMSQKRPTLRRFLSACTRSGDAIAWLSGMGGSTIQMEYIQIHPTAEAENHILITEAVRGNGTVLVNHAGERFVDEMDTRDVALL